MFSLEEMAIGGYVKLMEVMLRHFEVMSSHLKVMSIHWEVMLRYLEAFILTLGGIWG